MTDACKTCPFKIGSLIHYDKDSIEAFRSGLEPNCHQVVGMESIFREMATNENRCNGYEAFMEDMPGFHEPKVIP